MFTLAVLATQSATRLRPVSAACGLQSPSASCMYPALARRRLHHHALTQCGSAQRLTLHVSVAPSQLMPHLISGKCSLLLIVTLTIAVPSVFSHITRPTDIYTLSTLLIPRSGTGSSTQLSGLPSSHSLSARANRLSFPDLDHRLAKSLLFSGQLCNFCELHYSFQA